MEDELYLEIYSLNARKNMILCPIETAILLLVKEYSGCRQISLHLINSKPDNLGTIPRLGVKLSQIRAKALYFRTQLENGPILCKFPAMLVDGNTLIAGLCSVARQIIKTRCRTESNAKIRSLLGFREACLAACNENSIWTRFCEVDLVACLNRILPLERCQTVDRDLLRFERHMSRPIRAHNVYKLARNQARAAAGKKVTIESSTAVPELGLEHKYAEGAAMTLADLIIYPCFHAAVHRYGAEVFSQHLPLAYRWFRTLQAEHSMPQLLRRPATRSVGGVAVDWADVRDESMYTSDPARHNASRRAFTKQADVEASLRLFDGIECEWPRGAPDSAVAFDWSRVPLEANPEGGALPQKRSRRKCDQLENLARPVLTLAASGDRIVDFCSGSGHLGILLAVLLRDCTVVLLENKERSLQRARERVASLRLDNVVLLQCNLDYFDAPFDIGVSLHACGVATDLVLQQCLRRRAAFVCCPCCYGGVRECHHLSYPRSRLFRRGGLSLPHYLVLGHAADQSAGPKSAQGARCMAIIDLDRCQQARELGYEVRLYKMRPEDCSPKNNVLVGVLPA